MLWKQLADIVEGRGGLRKKFISGSGGGLHNGTLYLCNINHMRHMKHEHAWLIMLQYNNHIIYKIALCWIAEAVEAEYTKPF